MGQQQRVKRKSLSNNNLRQSNWLGPGAKTKLHDIPAAAAASSQFDTAIVQQQQQQRVIQLPPPPPPATGQSYAVVSDDEQQQQYRSNTLASQMLLNPFFKQPTIDEQQLKAFAIYMASQQSSAAKIANTLAANQLHQNNTLFDYNALGKFALLMDSFKQSIGGNRQSQQVASSDQQQPQQHQSTPEGHLLYPFKPTMVGGKDFYNCARLGLAKQQQQSSCSGLFQGPPVGHNSYTHFQEVSPVVSETGCVSPSHKTEMSTSSPTSSSSTSSVGRY